MIYLSFLLFLIDCFHNALSREIHMTISGKPENTTDEIAIQCFEMIKNMYSKEYSEILIYFMLFLFQKYHLWKQVKF